MTNDDIKVLLDSAEADFRATTISYPEWVRRVERGSYPDVKLTKWWQALDKLDRAEAALVVAPPPPPPDPDPTPTPTVPTVVMPDVTVPVGPTMTATPSTFSSVLSNAGTDTIIVLGPGDYSGSYTVTKRVSFIGLPGAWPVFKGRLRLQGAGTKVLGGFIIDGTGLQTEGIWMDGADQWVQYMIIRNTYGDGIFGGGLRGMISYNWIHHCGRLFTNGVPQKHGVYWAGGSDGRIEYNVIEDNQGHGVQLHPYSASTNILVRKNTILRNGNQAWGAHQGASGVILDAGSGALGATIDGNIVAYHAKECGIRKLGSTAGQIVKNNCAWLNEDGSFPKTTAFYGAGLVDGGGNVELEPFKVASAGYGSPLYKFS